MGQFLPLPKKAKGFPCSQFMKKVLKELLLVPIAFIVFGLLSIAGIFYTLKKHAILLDYSLEKQLYPILRSFNLALDGFANACAGELLNDKLKVFGRIKYGKWYQTISAVSGLLFIFENKNSKLRQILNKLEEDHCEKAVTKEDYFFWKNNLE